MSERPSRAARAARSSALTDREREVLDRLSKGQRNAEIARELQISVETARMHTKHLYRKLGVSSRGELLGLEL
jgi:DNA-binding CsgD family transcriptional regulator